MKQLMTVNEAESLSIEQVWDYYRKYVSQSQVSLIGTFGFGRETVSKAEGCYITTTSGRRILDLTGGIGVLSHGHNHPRIIETRRRFAESRRMEVHKNFFSPYVAALSANIAQLLPGDLNISYFPNSGAEAVEGAVKMAFKYHAGKRSKVLHSSISFHGKLLGAAGLTGSPELQFKFPTIPGVHQFEYNNIASFEQQIRDLRKEDGTSDVYAVLLEPLNASSMRHCTAEFLLRVQELCRDDDIILIFDEVYTGWAKTGYLFNFMRVPELLPDIVTYAKSFGGGKASISGYTAREFVFRKAYDSLDAATLHSTTYYGFGEETATAIEAINVIIDEDFVGRAQQIGAMFRDTTADIPRVSGLVDEIRGSGGLWGILMSESRVQKLVKNLSRLLPGELFRDPRFASKLAVSTVINRLYEKHDILSFYGSNEENPLIISFPLIATESEVRHAADALCECFDTNLLVLMKDFIETRLKAPRGH